MDPRRDQSRGLESRLQALVGMKAVGKGKKCKQKKHLELIYGMFVLIFLSPQKTLLSRAINSGTIMAVVF